MHDIVLIELGLNILEGNITKPGQANLSERAIDDHITSKGWETNLTCQAIDRLGRARLNRNSTGRWGTEPFRIICGLSFALRAAILGLLLPGGWDIL